MVFAPDDGARDRLGVQSEQDYKGKADAIRVIATSARIGSVSQELLALARQYEQLGEFTRKYVTAWLSKIRELTSEDKESPAQSADRSPLI
jgi:hypothetical protein